MTNSSPKIVQAAPRPSCCPWSPRPIDIRAAQRFLGELRDLRDVIDSDIKIGDGREPRA